MTEITVLKGNIEHRDTDAIVNAANNGLLGGFGVDGAIHAAAGPELLKACQHIRDQVGMLPTGLAVTTQAGNLPSKMVIHTVGPIWSRLQPDAADILLKLSYQSSLWEAAMAESKTIAFPNISTGAYGFPKERAAKVAILAVREWCSYNTSIDEVEFVCYEDENYDIYQELGNKIRYNGSRYRIIG